MAENTVDIQKSVDLVDVEIRATAHRSWAKETLGDWATAVCCCLSNFSEFLEINLFSPLTSCFNYIIADFRERKFICTTTLLEEKNQCYVKPETGTGEDGVRK